MAKQAAASRASSATPRTSTTAAPRKKRAPRVSGVKTPVQPTHEQISERAFQLYQARGAHDGGALHDWLAAEAELRT